MQNLTREGSGLALVALPPLDRGRARGRLLHHIYRAVGAPSRVLPLVWLRPWALQPGLLEHLARTSIRVDHEPGAARPPLPPWRPLLTDLSAPHAVLLRLPASRDAGRDPDAGAGARRLAGLSPRQAEAARRLRGMVGARLLPVRAAPLHQPVRLSLSPPLGRPARIRPVLP